MTEQKTQEKDFRYIVRIANTDLDGKKQILIALKKIKGVGKIFSNAVINATGIDKAKKTGHLTDQEVEKINDVLTYPKKYGFPSWMLNRRKDYESGEDTHFITTDLKFNNDNDIKRLKMTKSNRGMRHAAGLPLRGQRTKSNFRRNKGKGSLGVKKKGDAKDKK